MRTALFLPVLLVLSGCGLLTPTYERCDETPPYAAAREIPPLRVPEGLASPNTRNALRIPEVDGASTSRRAIRAAASHPGAELPHGGRSGRLSAPEWAGNGRAADLPHAAFSGEVAEWSKALDWNSSNT
jgi:hypothetical protein